MYVTGRSRHVYVYIPYIVYVFLNSLCAAERYLMVFLITPPSHSQVGG